MVAVDGVLAALRSIESQHLGVHPERCVMVRNRNGGCLRCAQVCASGAISFVNGELKIDADLCIGCGTCATICPTCALEALHPADADLYEQAAAILAEGGDTLVVSCARAMKREYKRVAKQAEAQGGFSLGRKGEVPFEFERILQVVCLGRLDESFYVEAAARGAREVVVCCESCDSCKYRNGGILAVDVIESAMKLLSSHGQGLDISFEEKLPEWAYAPGRGPLAGRRETSTRREFLSSARDMAKKTAMAAVLEERKAKEQVGEVALPKVDESGCLPHFTPMRRLRLFNSLRSLGPARVDEVQTRLWGRVDIDVEKCSSCRMCATFCPTGALLKYDTPDGGIGVDHRSALCVQCRMCANICAKDAVFVSDQVSLSAFEEGSVERMEMKPLSWKPNRPDSIFTKVNVMFGEGKNNTWF